MVVAWKVFFVVTMVIVEVDGEARTVATYPVSFGRSLVVVNPHRHAISPHIIDLWRGVHISHT